MNETTRQELLDRKRRFDEKWKVSETAKAPDGTPCWQWTALAQTPHAKPYGVFKYGRDQSTTAHRSAYMIYVSSYIPEGYEVHHICRNHGCVNPDHLELVTRQVNCELSYTKIG